MRVLDNKDIVRLLRAEVAKAGNQSAWAKKVGVERADVSKTLHGRMPPSKKVIRALGLRIVVVRG